MESINEVLESIRQFLNYTVFSNGASKLTIGNILYLIFGTWLVFFLSKLIRRLVIDKLLAKYGTDKGVSHAIGAIFRYVFVFVGLIIVFQTTGIDLSALTVLVGALGVGIGFGLQNVTNNFISGIIILFERPIKVGDRVELPELDNIIGNVVNISARSTTIITNDNIAIIVPNSKFISDTVINWSYNDANVRFNIPVGVAYKEDPEVVREILLEVALSHPGVLKKPAPDVIFDEYADSSINFSLRVYTTEFANYPRILKSELYYAIFRKFKEKGIEIPFPQQDVYIKQNG
ncbi:MAG TPA: mechanosensitive ion channel [Tenuifilaceae bacterium]|nr:mechanosensitive ion channel [Tenuifilaceae bacterium]HPE19614.1 mechanosensitive ion channel [Tenuifilaceae bacterium]HPJ47207.1 mechanosensitive ion channel [Tenuifilaceae bacterium]HPQ35830.1 mechanosensitive ion channel [Tenuifilaceae bacterium]HRX69446.1 mechanosensitive ion channel [Tenuifilaceae bacterium]